MADEYWIMNQRTHEWIEKDNKEYHARQFREPYRSTVAFCSWLEKIGLISPDSELRILDVGTGQGANVFYMGKRYPRCSFVGLDINADNIAIGNQLLNQAGISNCELVVGDVYNLDRKHVSAFDGVVSFQTLSWLPAFKQPLESIADLRATWLALTSLFYAGPVSCDISVKQFDEELNQVLDIYYNIYSLPIIETCLRERRYGNFQSTEFEIDIDIPLPESKLMSTYTRNLEDGSRLQVSGPLLMPWHFVACERDESL